jgi:hypothetical protein
MASAQFDDSEWITAFARLRGPLKESLARRMCVSGGAILRDEAKRRAARAPVWKYNPTSWGSQQKGTLVRAIYLAFNEKLSNTYQFTYSISWNRKIAPYGHLVEFGYKQIYAVFMDRTGEFHTNKRIRLKKPRRIPATPFLGTAYDSHLMTARMAMLERGRQELPRLLAEKTLETADV